MALTDARPFVIGATQTQICGDDGEAVAYFARHRAIACTDVLDPPFLASLLKICSRAQFVSDDVRGLGHREIEAPPIAGTAITLALNRADLLRWLERVTQCGPLGSTDGRVVQARAEARDHLRWHDDLNEPRRRLAITINLSDQPFEGGSFELGNARSGEVLLKHRHVQPGSALIFEVARGLEHRVLPLTSGGPRRVYTGWFLASDAQ